MGDQVAGEKADVFATCLTLDRLNPQEIFNMGQCAAAFKASGSIQVSDFVFKVLSQVLRLTPIGVEIDMFQLPLDDPVSHRVDIVPNDVTPDPVGLNQGDSAPHERIRNPESFKSIRLVIAVA